MDEPGHRLFLHWFLPEMFLSKTTATMRESTEGLGDLIVIFFLFGSKGVP